MIRSILLASLVLLTSCASTVRSVWRDAGNADLAGEAAPPLEDGTWLLPPTDDELAQVAPDDWRPVVPAFRLVVFLQPH